MAKRTCSIDGCDDPHRGRGWCNTHLLRWQRYGDPNRTPSHVYTVGDPPTRFWAKVNKTDGCWLWTASTRYGYGTFNDGSGTVAAHRFAYQLVVGPIPNGLQLDHLCHTDAVARGECEGGDSCQHRRCVNPSHLEPVTGLDNSRRGNAGEFWAMKTHCPHGHPYSDENTYHNKGRRFCRTCNRVRRKVRD